MFPDNSPEPFSQYHSPGKGFYTQLIIEYSPLITIILKRASAQFQLCRHFLVGQIAFAAQHGTVSDRQILDPDQHTVKTSHDTVYPFSAVCSQFSPVIMDLVVIV